MKVVFRKEVKEMLRDRRVTMGAFLFPVFLIFMMMQMMSTAERGITQNRASNIAVIKGTETTALVQGLQKIPNSKILVVDSPQQGREQLREGKARLLLIVPPDFDAAVTNRRAEVTAVYDGGQPLSQVAMRTLETIVAELNKQLAVETLKTNNIPASTLETIKVSEEDAAPPAAKDSGFLLSFLPYMIVLWAFYGGFSAVSDMMAGEKERGTLETLLLTPVSRSQIAFGKLAALALICMLSSLSAVIGVALASLTGKQGSLQLDLAGFLGVIAQIVPLVAMFAGILFLVSTWAKNMREAQTYLTLISFIVLIPAVFSNLIGFTGADQAPWLKFVPVLNVGVGLRDSLLGRTDWVLVGTAGALHLAVAGVCVVVVQRMMERDTVLVRI